MKNMYLVGIITALIGMASANKGDRCLSYGDCMSVMPDLPHRDMTTEFAGCFKSCSADVKACCQQDCASLSSCRTYWSNCFSNCRSHLPPTHSTCMDTCMNVWNNCMTESVTIDAVLDHNTHCNNDFSSCRMRCHKE
ncbi:hypothetical protein N7478_011960 [Penicillium angulare]|uniref:uncharacterized protein n=1 Tax=Penicillium angulare TaxID=116970 RepID=UPI00254222C7|nr:uncharacterized protein N7478_011960 [Penicillium angulare]KAJ5261365.1 hypothetical protein N7478_011960 [Penicillium angulare]